MLEKYKLNKYFNCMVGFAYEETNIKRKGRHGNVKRTVQTYIVIPNGEELKFINYRKYKCDTYTYESVVDNLIEMDAMPVENWLEQRNNVKILKRE